MIQSMCLIVGSVLGGGASLSKSDDVCPQVLVANNDTARSTHATSNRRLSLKGFEGPPEDESYIELEGSTFGW
jgi:hypothetical protein